MVLMKGKSEFAPAAAGAERIDREAAWRQLTGRDPEASFFYAVSTTGVFCRPGCPSRRPLRVNVRFFPSAAAARAAGFRPCRRCRPEDTAEIRPLEKLRAHIEANLNRQLPLAELGRLVHRSPFTVQRLFKRALGVSPLEYQRALRMAGLRQALQRGESVTNAIYEAGFGSSSRVYQGAPLGMTPARFARGGKGARIGWCAAETPFGWMIVGATERGLCWLSLSGSEDRAEASLRAEFPMAAFERDPSLATMVDAALAEVCDPANAMNSTRAWTLPQLDLRGTAFQLRVWQALRRIPRGETRSYRQLAQDLGEPRATRAVARACAMNRVALLVPCHRVVGARGELTGYRWGVERKRQLLAAEARRG
ncbi:MAG: methylated-DNA--[protein]-cysteine S-methyltransferase [Terracidiphilus sp.]